MPETATRSAGPRGRDLGFGTLAALCVAFLAVACAGPRYAHVERPPTFSTPKAVTVDAVLSRSSDPAAELASLPSTSHPAIELRRAFLELELGRPDRAIAATSRVLYGTGRNGKARAAAEDQAFAHYLVAKAYIKRGTPDLARFDLEQARRLTMNDQLLALLDEPKPLAKEPTNALGRLSIHPRSSWKAARPDRRNLDRMDTVERITIHHSAMYLRSRAASSAAGQLRRVQHEHMKGRGYGDIGYHFLIDPSGRIWQGRELRWQGAHAGGASNIRNVGICVLGNFVRGGGGQEPTRAQVSTLLRLVRAIQGDYQIPRSQIYRHSDFKATECPGARMEPVMALLRSRSDTANLARWE